MRSSWTDAQYAVAPREAVILEILMRRSNRVVPKKFLEDQLYGLSVDGSVNAVEVHVHRLRKQLTETGADVAIHTVRGVGYLIKEETLVTGRSPSILQRIVWLHVLALAAVTIAITAAAYFLLNATVNDFEERDPARSCRQRISASGAGEWTLDAASAVRPAGNLFAGLWRLRPGRGGG